jgi:hypothetical protein
MSKSFPESVRKSSRSILVLVFLLVAGISSVSASVLCSSGGLADSSFVCTADGLTFNSFYLTLGSGFNLTNSSVNLTGASVLGNDVTLNFLPTFDATVNGARSINFGFTVAGGVTAIGTGQVATGGGTHTITQTCSPTCSGDPVALNILFDLSGNPDLNNGVVQSFSATFTVGETNVNPGTVPEPMTMGLIGSGLLGLGLLRKHRQKA